MLMFCTLPNTDHCDTVVSCTVELKRGLGRSTERLELDVPKPSLCRGIDLPDNLVLMNVPVI